MFPPTPTKICKSHQCYYPQTLRDSVSPVCGIFLYENHYFYTITTVKKRGEQSRAFKPVTIFVSCDFSFQIFLSLS